MTDEFDINTFSTGELRQEADRLLGLYQAADDATERLQLSTRYTKIDMLIDQRKTGNQKVGQQEEPFTPDTTPPPIVVQRNDDVIHPATETEQESSTDFYEALAALEKVLENKPTSPDDLKSPEVEEEVEEEVIDTSLIDALLDMESDPNFESDVDLDSDVDLSDVDLKNGVFNFTSDDDTLLFDSDRDDDCTDFFKVLNNIDLPSSDDLPPIPEMELIDNKHSTSLPILNTDSDPKLSQDTQSTTPPSLNEEWPKKKLSETQRSCTKCGEATAIAVDQCSVCLHIDPSLGIVNVITTGDLLQAWRLLEVKRTIVHTRTSSHEWTLLHMASSAGNIRLVELLIEAGAPIDAQNIHGKTALHYAASKGHKIITQILLGHHANTQLRFENKTPLELAMECEQMITADILREKKYQQ